MMWMQQAARNEIDAKRFAGAWTLILAITMACALAGIAEAQAITPRVSAGGNFSAALSSHSVVWTWGSNSYGQLGRPGSGQIPQAITGIPKIVDIACGGEHMLALTATGSVMGWGQNGYGQLGLGHSTNQSTPQQLPTISTAIKVAAGESHSLVLLANGTVLGFGYGAAGQLGLGNTNNYFIPMSIPGLSNVVSIAAGRNHSAAVVASGSLFTWGSNSGGQLGNGQGTWAWASAPTMVANLAGIIGVACGYETTVCLDSTGSVRECGQSISNTLSQASIVTLPFQAGQVAVTNFAGGTTARMALSTAGAVLTWGTSCSGTLGNGQGGCSSITTPVQPAGLGTGVAAIAFGGDHGLAMTQGGAVFSWGQGGSWQLGYTPTGPNNSQTTPALIPGLDLNVFALYLTPVGQYTELRYFHGEPGSIYANLCTAAVQTPVPSGLISIGGLWLGFADMLAWSAFIQAGYPMATGSINATGTAVTTLPMPNSALAGVTINAVSFNLLAGNVSNISPIATHTF